MSGKGITAQAEPGTFTGSIRSITSPLLPLLLLTVALLLTLIKPYGSLAADDKALELWIHPYLPATQLHQRFTPLAAYLGEKTGKPVQVKVSRDYADHIERVGLDQADIAYIGPISYVVISGKYGPKPALAGLEVNGSPAFHGVIIVPTDSDIATLDQFAGRSFAFGDPNSTMSHLLPRYMLLKAGVTADNLEQYRHLKSHEDVALAVIGEYFDGGAVKEEVFLKYRERGLRAVAKSPPMPEHLFVTRSDLEPETVTTLCEAMLTLEGGPGLKEALTSIKSTVTGLRPVNDGIYDIYRELLDELKNAGVSP